MGTPTVNQWAVGRNLARRLAMTPACFVFDNVFGGVRVSGVQVCESCERVAGDGSMIGAQRLGGLWRLYPRTDQARRLLLINGIEIEGVSSAVMDKNPFLALNDSEKPTVKITIGNVPFSVSNVDIEKALKNVEGVKLCNNLFDECYRREGGELTTWKTGRKYGYIETPNHSLPSFFQVGKWKASLYHYGQTRPERNNKETKTTTNKHNSTGVQFVNTMGNINNIVDNTDKTKESESNEGENREKNEHEGTHGVTHEVTEDTEDTEKPEENIEGETEGTVDSSKRRSRPRSRPSMTSPRLARSASSRKRDSGDRSLSSAAKRGRNKSVVNKEGTSAGNNKNKLFSYFDFTSSEVAASQSNDNNLPPPPQWLDYN